MTVKYKPSYVFISYSSKDKNIANAVCHQLESEKIKCWIAPRDIIPGHSYGEDIISGIENAKIILLIYSANSQQSIWVKKEVERAISKGLIIIPFRIEDVMPSKEMEFYISNAHWLDAFTAPLENHIIELIRVIKSLVKKHETSTSFENDNNSNHLENESLQVINNEQPNLKKSDDFISKNNPSKIDIVRNLENRIRYAIQLNANQRAKSKILKARIIFNNVQKDQGFLSFTGKFTAENPIKIFFNYPFNYSGKFKGETYDLEFYKIRELSFSSFWERIRGISWVDVRQELIDQANQEVPF